MALHPALPVHQWFTEVRATRQLPALLCLVLAEPAAIATQETKGSRRSLAPVLMDARVISPTHHDPLSSSKSTPMTRTKKGSLVATNRLKTNHRLTPASLVLPARGSYHRRGLRRGGLGMGRGILHPHTMRRNRPTTR